MNEQIREFVKQALKQPDTDNDGLTVFDDDELEKFAELIVKECADTVLGFHNQFGDTAHNEIKEHFGI